MAGRRVVGGGDAPGGGASGGRGRVRLRGGFRECGREGSAGGGAGVPRVATPLVARGAAGGAGAARAGHEACVGPVGGVRARAVA